MRKTTLICTLLVLGIYSAEAYGLSLYNRSGDTLCVAATRDEADPFDENVGRVTEGWKCVHDLATVIIDPSNGMLDIAVRRADGSDYVAGRALKKFPKIKVFVPKDDALDEFGVYILKHSRGWAAISLMIGPGNEWSGYQTVRDVEELPAKLDTLGFKQVDAWQIDAQHNGLGYTLK